MEGTSVRNAIALTSFLTHSGDAKLQFSDVNLKPRPRGRYSSRGRLRPFRLNTSERPAQTLWLTVFRLRFMPLFLRANYRGLSTQFYKSAFNKFAVKSLCL